MVTPIIFWHEWRILYWWDGREKESDGAKKTKTVRKKERKKERDHWQRKSEWYGNDLPHCLWCKTFPPLLRADDSKEDRPYTKHAKSARGVGDSRGAEEYPPQNAAVHHSQREESMERFPLLGGNRLSGGCLCPHMPAFNDSYCKQGSIMKCIFKIH